MHLQNHTAIITGAASGLGEATLRRFVGKGANAMILDVNDEGGAALMEELGIRVRFTHADVAAEAAVSASSMPSSTTKPRPILPRTWPPMVTDASLARWMTARMTGGRLSN